MINIHYNGYIFNGTGDDDLLLLAPTTPPDIYEVWAPISEQLAWDTLSFGVKSDATGTKYIWTSLGQIYSTSSNEEYVIDDGDLMDYTRGTPVQVYDGGTLLREFYLDSITARRGNLFEFSCISAVGLLAERYHMGGVYFGVSAGTIIADIMDTMPSDIEADVSSTIMYGWLPYDTARANLSRVLFATGASLMKKADGSILIKYNQPTSSLDVTANTYYDMESSPVERYGSIRVVEHTFFDSTEQTEAVLFDNTNSVAADHALIVFEEPQASIRGDGITVNSYGANWAIVTGTGIVYGKAYIHIRRMLEQATGISSSEQKEVADNGLISRLNSATVLERMVNYYSAAVLHKISTVHTSEQAGSLVVFPEITGISKSGYVTVLDRTVSAITKASMDVVTDWTPTGLGNQYTEYFYITSAPAGTISIPAAHQGKKALAVLFSGAQGGNGGHAGEKGHSGQPQSSSVVSAGQGGIGGLGGAGGQAGGCGRYLMVDINSLASSYSGSIGAGGAGGAAVGYDEAENEGSIGGDTVLGTFTTADGVVPEGPYINLLDGTIYGERGNVGNAGKAGGNGGNQPATRVAGTAGTDGENYNTVWLGGKGGAGFRDGEYKGSGGGGGGAAYGASAADATQHPDDRNPATAGANAVAPAQAAFYRGGDGGNGGGGGGGSEYRYNGMSANYSNGANGGSGSAGGQGADGFILVYV